MIIRLTELVEILVQKGLEVDEPNPAVRILVTYPDGTRAWLNPTLIATDPGDESVMIYTDPGYAELPGGLEPSDTDQEPMPGPEGEHWA
jgi:hypothetical protein